MPDNTVIGIGDFWTDFFERSDQVENIGRAFREALGISYNELANIVLETSHKDTPVYNRNRWYKLTLRLDEKTSTATGFQFPIQTTLHEKGLREAEIILSSPVNPKKAYFIQQGFNIGDGWIEFIDDPFEIDGIKITESDGVSSLHLWIPVADIDTNLIWKQYGHFLGDWRISSPGYKNFTRGMFHSRMLGPVIDRIETGLQLMAGLPVASESTGEVVRSIIQEAEVQTIRTNITDYEVPNGVGVTVNVGDSLVPFQTLTDAVTVTDHIIEPEWWQGLVNQLPAEIGHTVDIDKAFDQYLKYNTFLVKVNLLPFLSDISGITNSGNFDTTRLIEFINQFKPSYTYTFPLFFLGFQENVEPEVFTDIFSEVSTTEDRHFDLPSFRLMDNGLNMRSDTDMWPIGLTPGISHVYHSFFTDITKPECYRQIPFIECGTDDGYRMDSGVDLEDGKVLDSVNHTDMWCSPIDRRYHNLGDRNTMCDGLGFEDRLTDVIPQSMSMNLDMSSGSRMGKISDCGYVEETSIAGVSDLGYTIPIAEFGEIQSGTEQTEDKTFDYPNLSDGYKTCSEINLDSRNSKEEVGSNPGADIKIALNGDDCYLKKHIATLHDELDMSSGLAIGDYVRDEIFSDMSDGVTMDSAYSMCNRKPFCVAEDIDTAALTSSPEVVGIDDITDTLFTHDTKIDLSFNVFTLMDGKRMNDGLDLGKTGVMEAKTIESHEDILEDLSQQMEEAFKGPFTLRDNQLLGQNINMGDRLRYQVGYHNSDDKRLDSELGMGDLKPLGLVEHVHFCEIPSGMYASNIIPTGAVNGSNTLFSLPDTPVVDSLELYLEGLLMVNGVDYVLTGNVIDFIIPPISASLLAFYRKGVSNTGFVYGETPAGITDGNNKTFTIANTIEPESGLRVVIDGELQDIDSYRIGGTELRLAEPPGTNASVELYYRLHTNECFIDHELPAILADTYQGFVQFDMVQLNFVQTGLLKTLVLGSAPLDNAVMLYIGGKILTPGIDYILTGRVINVLVARAGHISIFYRI